MRWIQPKQLLKTILRLSELIVAFLSLSKAEVSITLKVFVLLNLLGVNDLLVVLDGIFVLFLVVVGACQVKVAFWLLGVELHRVQVSLDRFLVLVQHV